MRLRLRRPLRPSQGLANGKLGGDILAGGNMADILAGENMAGSLAGGNLLSGHLVCGGLLGRELLCGELLCRGVPREIAVVGRDDADLGPVGGGSGEGARL